MRLRLAAAVALAAAALGGCAGTLERLPLSRGLASPSVPTLVESPAGDTAAPRRVVAVSGELRAVPVYWDPVLAGDVAGYVVERAGPGAATFERVAVIPGRFRRSWSDRGPGGSGDATQPGSLADATTYRYRVRSFDAQGRIGATPSAEASATTAPLPAPPSGLRAYSHLPRRVALTWEPSGDPHVREYVIYRSPSEHGDFVPVARVRERFRTDHVDTGLGDLRVLHYRVASVSAAGGEGVASDPVRAVTKAKPLPPLALRVVEQRLGANRLAWERNVEPDLAGYRLLRWRAGRADPEVVATLDPALTTAWDEAVGAGERVAYRLVAFDRDGLESEPSEAVEVVSEGYGLRAEPSDAGLRLRWTDRTAEGWVRARILRARGLLRWLGPREIAVVEGEGYLDTEVAPGERVVYQVVLEKADGTRAPPSAPLEVVVPERERRAPR